MNTREEYDKIQALNWSTLKHLATSPKMLKYREDYPEPDKPHYKLGRAIHCAVLEPERWKECYRGMPVFGDMRRKENKAARAEWEKSVPPGCEVLSADDYALAERCARSVREHRVARTMFAGGRAEEPVVWTDPETGIKCKSRDDYITPRELQDLKSSSDRSVRRIIKSLSNFLYHGQMAWCHDGAIHAGLLPADADLPVVVVVQTVECYDVACFRMTHQAYEAGQAFYRSLLDRYAACKETGWWPGMAEELLPWEVEPWAPGAGEIGEEDEW